MQQLPLQIQLDDSATFENFFVASNRQLVNKLQQLNDLSEQLIYIWGSEGSGKTHLAQALSHSANIHQQLAIYLPLTEPALMPEVLNGMSEMDLVCIDDLNHVESNPNWEVALFDLYNDILLKQKNLVIFSDKAPLVSEIMLADLKSRLSAMEVYQLEPLSDDEKISLIEHRAKNRGLNLSTDVIQFVMSRKSRSVNDLIEVLDKLDKASIELKRKITIPLVKSLLNL